MNLKLMNSETVSEESLTPQNIKSLKKSKFNSIQYEKDYMKALADEYGFTADEVIMIKHRYDKLSDNGLLNQNSFRRGLGLLGLEHARFLCDRIFQVIDEKQEGIVRFEDFLKYMHTLIDGSTRQKAEQSFRMLDLKRNGRLLYNDIETIVTEMSVLWNTLTGSRVKPTVNYLKHIFSMFDMDKDGTVSFNDFYKIYAKGSDIFGWFEYLNQEDNPIEFWLSFENKKNDGSKERGLQEKIEILQDELDECLMFLQEYEDNNKKQDVQESFYELPSQRFQEKMVDRGGPTYMSTQVFKKAGDDEDVPDEDFMQNSGKQRSRYFTFDAEQSMKQSFSFLPKMSLGGMNQQSTAMSPTPNKTTRNLQFQDLTPKTPNFDIDAIRNKLYNLLEMTAALKGSASLEQDLNKVDFAFSKLVDSSYVAIKSTPSLLGMSPQKFPDHSPFGWNSEAMNLFSLEATSPRKTQHPNSFDESSSPGIRKPAHLATLARISQNNNKYRASLDTSSTRSSTSKTRGIGGRRGHLNPKQDIHKNISVFFGHENWNLVLNMMIGIRMALKSVVKITEYREMTENDYKIEVHFDLIQERLASFDARQACHFLEFAPLIFDDIRRAFGITSNDFLKSVGPENLLGNLIMGNMASLIEQSSAGKSGSFFYYSEDKKYMLKTISKKEFHFLKSIVRAYHVYLKNNPDSLIIRIYGMYKMSFLENKKEARGIYFVVMGNIFKTEIELKVKYDLKGSLHGRTARKGNALMDRVVVLKDLDFNEDQMQLKLQPADRQIFLKQIEKDSKFLASVNVNDYSLLLGVHFIPQYKQLMLSRNPSEDLGGSGRPSIFGPEKINQNHKQSSLSNNEPLASDENYPYLSQSQSFYERCQTGLLSSDGKKLYIMGVIDILTNFGASKKFEYGFKRTFLGKEISCIPPQRYSERFINYITSKVE